MQFKGDMMGKRIVRSGDAETTALGAAYLAGLATGFFKGLDELEHFWQAEKTYEPRMGADQREQLYACWQTAVARCTYTVQSPLNPDYLSSSYYQRRKRRSREVPV